MSDVVVEAIADSSAIVTELVVLSGLKLWIWKEDRKSNKRRRG